MGRIVDKRSHPLECAYIAAIKGKCINIRHKLLLSSLANPIEMKRTSFANHIHTLEMFHIEECAHLSAYVSTTIRSYYINLSRSFVL